MEKGTGFEFERHIGRIEEAIGYQYPVPAIGCFEAEDYVDIFVAVDKALCFAVPGTLCFAVEKSHGYCADCSDCCIPYYLAGNLYYLFLYH